MKTKISSLIVVAMVIFSSSFAGSPDSKPAQPVLNTFNHVFVNAKEVIWEKVNTYYKATFQLSGQYLFAFFTGQGEIMGVARNISPTELPILLKGSLNKDHAGFWISDLFEHATKSETTYYVTLENADHQVILKSVGSHDWTVFKKTNKA